MSTIAEVFGVVTGALTVVEVSVRTGTGIFKLKQIWDEIREVLQTITALIYEINMLNPLLAELEADTNLAQSISAMYGDPSPLPGPITRVDVRSLFRCGR